MSDNDSKNPMQLLPRLDILDMRHDPLTIGGLDNASAIREINFYSRLNSFSFNADITVEDVDNRILNILSEPNATKATISLYEDFEIDSAAEKLKSSTAKRVFQKTFSVDSIKFLQFGKAFPQKSIIKLNLTDIFESLILNKLICYSNFDLKWDSSEMDVEATLHHLLADYERYAGKLVINPKLFGTNTKALKRRFVTDRSTSLKNVFDEYIDALYDTRWNEYLTNSQPNFDIPHCMLAYSNFYYIDSEGIFRRRPYLVASNMLDIRPNNSIYSIPYPKTGKILDYARKDYNICVEDTDIDLRGSLDGELKDKLFAAYYVQHRFDPKRGLFDEEIKGLDKIHQLNPALHPDIESQQKPKYLGIGSDPDFSQMENFDKDILLAYPFNIKENKYYFSNGENSFYRDMTELLFKTMIYVSIPFSAWHSPGQEIDLRMITADYASVKPDKQLLYSLNKIASGRWKIMNSVTSFKTRSSSSIGLTPVETVGLNRTRYFHGEN